MSKSKRINVFSETERKELYEIPNFSDEEREEYFTFTQEELSVIIGNNDINRNIFCALQIGYFKITKSFPAKNAKDLSKKDIEYIKNRYFLDYKWKRKTLKKITDYEFYKQRRSIIELFWYKLWDSRFKKELLSKIKIIIKKDISPNYIGFETVKYLEVIKVVRPEYTTLQSIISEGLTDERYRTSDVIGHNMTKEERQEIQFLMKAENQISNLAELQQDAKNFGFKMMHKEREKHKILKALYTIATKVINKLNISQQNIRYYADLAVYYNIRDLVRLKHNQNYLYVLCYVYIKYQSVNDNLLEGFKYNTRKIDENIRNKARKRFYEEKSDTEKKVGKLLLLYVDDKIKDEVVFAKVRKRAYRIMDKEIIEKVGNRYNQKSHHEKQIFWEEVDGMRNTYQKNLRPFFNCVKFESDYKNNSWIRSINWLKNSFNQKEIGDKPDNMPKTLGKYLVKKDGSVDADRYEYWLYNQIEEKLRSGIIYVSDSLLHNCFNNELATIEESKKALKDTDSPWVNGVVEHDIDRLLEHLDSLWVEINKKYRKGELNHLRYDKDKDRFVWSKIRAENTEKVDESFYTQLPISEIDKILSLVNEKTQFLSALKPLQDRYHREDTISVPRKIAAILSKALNHGDYRMSHASDISYQELRSTTAQTLRLDTLREANNILSNETNKLPIIPHYAIDLEFLFSSLDGQKYELETPNIKARNSKKYLREKPGVSAYTILANNIPFNSYVIGSNEHESYYVFDIWYNNATNIDPHILTGDMHSINKCNFAILHCFGKEFKPRFTNLNNELKNICGSSDLEKYSKYKIAPTKLVDRDVIIDSADEITQILGTLALKDINQANLIKKLCNLPPENKYRKGIFELDKLIRSIYTLEYMIDFDLQKKVHKSQNKIEEYHKLRAIIARVGGRKKLYGKTALDIEVSNQCGRLVANAIIYYNSLILSGIIEANKQNKNFNKIARKLRKISPIAWQHIHFLGQYTFKGNDNTIDINEILKTIAWDFEFNSGNHDKIGL